MSECALFIKYYDADKKSIFSKSFAANVNGEWVPLSGEGVAPDNAAYCQIYAAGVSTGIGDAYVDAVSLYEGRYCAYKR